MIYGYCRVSATGQGRDGNGLEAQRNELAARGAQRFFQGTFAGTGTDRPELPKLLDAIQPGDTLMVARMDRLGRSTAQVNELITSLLERGIRVHVLNMGVMDNSQSGRLMRTMMLAFAEFERDMMLERTKEGRAAARQRPGYREGRNPKYSRRQIDHAMELLEDHSYTQVAQLTGISKSTLARARRKRKAARLRTEG